MSTTPPWWAKDTTRPVLTPSAVRKRTTTGTLTGLAAVLITATAAAHLLTPDPVPATEAVPGGGLAHRQTTQALIGGCGPTYQFTARPGEDTPIPAPKNGTKDETPAKYRTIVPMVGPYIPATHTTLTRRFYTPTDTHIPTPEQLLGHARTGTLIAWYTPDATPEDVTNLQRLTTDPTLNLVAAPWPKNRGNLPANRKVAYATWGYSQTCQRVVPSVLGEFRTALPAGYAPDAPAPTQD